jgi:hypothetical protein
MIHISNARPWNVCTTGSLGTAKMASRRVRPACRLSRLRDVQRIATRFNARVSPRDARPRGMTPRVVRIGR